MSHDRNARADNRRDGAAEFVRGTFQFHGLCAAFLDKPTGMAQRFLGGDLIRQKRHVADDHRPSRRTRHHARVVNHLVHRDAERIRQTHDDVRARIADEQHIDPGVVHEFRGGIIVGGQHGDLFARLLALPECHRRDTVHDSNLLARDVTRPGPMWAPSGAAQWLLQKPNIRFDDAPDGLRRPRQFRHRLAGQRVDVVRRDFRQRLEYKRPRAKLRMWQRQHV